MSLPVPNLDDRTFDQLLAEARRILAERGTAWSANSASDPGVVLLELFAHLTETMLYRLNRLPEKAYIEFLRLLGLRLHPPSAARVDLVFSLAAPAPAAVVIPAGTEVAANRAESGGQPAVFTTLTAATIPAGSDRVTIRAIHATAISEAAGTGTGKPGQVVEAKRAPIVARLGADDPFAIGVEIAREELREGMALREEDGVTYRLWREVDDFTDLGADTCACIVDRQLGRVYFPGSARLRDPADPGVLAERASALGAYPGEGRRIRLWYHAGGGPSGNLPGGSLTRLVRPLPGVGGLAVANPQPATGGREAESLENASERGPFEFYSLRRAVTALDYELIAVNRCRDLVSRAKAYTRSQVYPGCDPGTVDVLLVPRPPAGPPRRPTRAEIAALQTDAALDAVTRALDECRPLGSAIRIAWVPCKQVAVAARVVTRRHTDADAIRAKVGAAIDRRLDPLARDGAPGRDFGAPLRASQVYDAILAVPGVAYVEGIALEVDQAPAADVGALAADSFKPHTWYAGSGERLFVSVNDGAGWELATTFPGERILRIFPHPQVPGLVAAISVTVPAPVAPADPAKAESARLESAKADAAKADPAKPAPALTPTKPDTPAKPDAAAKPPAPPAPSRAGRVYFSKDYGQTWSAPCRTSFILEDGAWAVRDGVPTLFLASDHGLISLTPVADAIPELVLVDAQKPDQRFYAVATASHGGVLAVAVAAEALGGVYLSYQGGRTGSFTHIGLKDLDIRVLEVQATGNRYHLWAGLASIGNDPGKGTLVGELPLAAVPADRSNPPPPAWRWASKGWNGGTCKALTFAGNRVYAASYRSGVLAFDFSQPDAAWVVSAQDCGLPLRSTSEQGTHLPVETIAADDSGTHLLAGGAQGVFRASEGLRFSACSQRTYLDKLPLPPTWLFCAGYHRIDVTEES